MERKIGEIFEYNGEWYQCIRSILTCSSCEIPRPCTKIRELGCCSPNMRNDKEQVVFKKLEKVGKPYITFVDKTVQNYLLETAVSVPPRDVFTLINNEQRLIAIKIKQNKEDMEEKKQCDDNRFEVIEKAKRHLLHSTNIESNKEEMKLLDVFLLRCWQMGWLDSYDDAKHSNSENIGNNLREFDLKAAKAGKPVCTRDGRKARIICFDRKDIKPIVALVTVVNDTSVTEKALYYFEDGHHLSKEYLIEKDNKL